MNGTVLCVCVCARARVWVCEVGRWLDMFTLQNKRQLLCAVYASAVTEQTKVALVNVFRTARSHKFCRFSVQKLQNISRLLTGTSRSLSKGVKPEGEDSPSNGDDVAADKVLSALPCVKNFTSALN